MTDDRFKFITLWMTIVGLCSWLLYEGIIKGGKFVEWIDTLLGKL